MKKEISDYFQFNRSYAAGVALVMKYSTRLALKKQLNIHPQSDYLKGVIFEELREIAGIKDPELKAMLLKPVEIATTKQPKSEILKELEEVGEDPQEWAKPSVLAEKEKKAAQAKPATPKKASRKK